MGLEQYLESNFKKWCDENDIIPIKGPSSIVKGFPDRFVQLPNGGGTVYVEFKGSSYYDLTPLQVYWKKYLLKSSPNRYFKIDTKEQLEQLKQTCLAFIEIGKQLTEFEHKLLTERGIMKINQEDK